jgi:peroxiredoxin Q/BCP
MKADFELPDKDGNLVSLRELRGKWVVVYFYPRDMTPGCTIEAHEFTRFLPDFRKSRAQVLGISPDSEESHCDFYDKEKLKLTLLSDRGAIVARKFGAYGKKKLYGKEYEGMIRSTFLVNPEGEIAFLWKSVKPLGHAEAVLKKLREIEDAA